MTNHLSAVRIAFDTEGLELSQYLAVGERLLDALSTSRASMLLMSGSRISIEREYASIEEVESITGPVFRELGVKPLEFTVTSVEFPIFRVTRRGPDGVTMTMSDPTVLKSEINKAPRAKPTRKKIEVTPEMWEQVQYITLSDHTQTDKKNGVNYIFAVGFKFLNMATGVIRVHEDGSISTSRGTTDYSMEAEAQSRNLEEDLNSHYRAEWKTLTEHLVANCLPA